MLACVALALPAVRLNHRLAAPVLCGLLVGASANFKLHSPLYFLPVAYVLHRRQGWQGLALAAPVAILSFVAAFLFPQVSAHDYLGTLLAGANREFVWTLFLENTLRSLYLSAPALLLPSRAVEAETITLGFIASICP